MMEDDSHDFQGRSLPVLVVSIIFSCLASIFVFLRMLSRGAIVKRITADDWLMLAAWAISAVGMTIAIGFGAAYGLGRHEADIPEDWQYTLKRANYAFSVLYNPALMAEKTSILVFYLSLSQTREVFRWATIATLVVVNVGGLALTLLNVFQCRPVGAVLDLYIPDGGYCIDIVTIYLSSAPLNIITDFAILFLPLPILTSMRMPTKQKIILIITFSFGAFAAAVDVVRISALQSAAQTRIEDISSSSQGIGTGGTSQSEDLDISWYAAFSFMWSIIEVNVGIMCGCVPALKPLASRFLPRLLRDSADDATVRSDSGPKRQPTVDMVEAHRVPSVDDERVYHRTPPEPHFAGRQDDADDGPMGMLDFLTTPDMAEFPVDRLQRTQTAMTNTSRHTKLHEPMFDFVNIQQKKSLVHLSNKESIFPISMVTILFFVWGFEYGLLDVLNQQFQQVARMSVGQTTAIHSAYYAGYLIGPWLVGRWVLNNWGFKACFSVGLSIYACGTLVFWPAAVLTSFPAYLVVNLIVGSGLSILETSANPFIALCGPARYAEVRLNLSQGVQAIGTVIAPLIADVGIVAKVSDNNTSLVSTQYAYLGIALFTILLAVAYHYVPLPEASDSELEDVSERVDGANKVKVGGLPIMTITLGILATNLFLYVGAQEVVGAGIGEFMATVRPDLSVSTYVAIAHTAFVISRFLGAGLALWVKPRILIVGFYLGAVLFQALAISLSGGAAVAMLVMVFFMEGPLFSLLFAQGIRGQGRNTKFASVVLASAISGGAAFAPASNILATSTLGGQRALIIAVTVFSAGALTAMMLSIDSRIKTVIDPGSASEALGSGASTGLSTANVEAKSRMSMFKIPHRHTRSSGSAEFRERATSS